MAGTESTENSKRLSFNQKFWLISTSCMIVICLLFLIAVSMAPAKKTLNTTEEQLLGYWKFLDSSDGVSYNMKITPSEIQNNLRKDCYFWRAEPGSLYFQNGDWISKFKLSFGKELPEVRWEITRLDETRLELTYPGPGGKITRVFERMDSE